MHEKQASLHLNPIFVMVCLVTTHGNDTIDNKLLNSKKLVSSNFHQTPAPDRVKSHICNELFVSPDNQIFPWSKVMTRINNALYQSNKRQKI